MKDAFGREITYLRLIGCFNDGEIPALSELTRRYPVDVRFIELMPMVDGGFGPDSFPPCGMVLEGVPFSL